TGNQLPPGVRQIGGARARGIKIRLKASGASRTLSAAPARRLLMREVLADLRRATGAFVIAAAASAEFAVEAAAWRNGVFTHAILEAARTGAADADGDGRTTVGELERYVAAAVLRLTGGRQRPAARRENRAMDFAVLAGRAGAGSSDAVAAAP